MTSARPNSLPEIDLQEKLLTIVIPHFNQSKILPRAVASVLGSTQTDIEIIIVDDGSADGSEPVLAVLEHAHPSIRIIRSTKNEGAPAALNTGLAQARGRYISFLGADDFVLPTLYSTMVSRLEQNPSAALACGHVAIIDINGRVRGIRPFTAPAFHEQFLSPETVRQRIRSSDNWICNTSAVYRTELIRNVGGYDVSLGPFCDGFLSRVLAFTHGFIFVPGVHGVWQVSPGSLSASSILDRGERAQLIASVQERLTNSPIGQIAPDYAAIYARRLRFSAVRMHFFWYGENSDPMVIAEAAGDIGLDRKILVLIRSLVGFGYVGRVLALSWLAIRMRPFPPVSLLLHLIQYLIVARPASRKVKDALSDLEISSAKLVGRRVNCKERLQSGPRLVCSEGRQRLNNPP